MRTVYVICMDMYLGYEVRIGHTKYQEALLDMPPELPRHVIMSSMQYILETLGIL